MTSPLTAIMISPSGVLGGAEAIFADLANAGPAHGLDLRLVVLQDGPLVGSLQAKGHEVEVIRAGRLRQPRAVLATGRSLRQVIDDSRAKIVVSSMPKAHLYAAIPARFSGIPAVWWQAGIPSPAHWLDRVASALPADLVLAMSEAGAAAQRGIRRTPPVRVVYPGTDTGRYHPGVEPTLRGRLGAEPDEVVVGLVGRLEPWKGQATFLRAARLVLARAEVNCRFAIVGGALLGWEGDYPEQLEALAEELGIRDRVVFTGHCDDMPGVFTSLDIVVNASTAEPFGLVVTEAMAAGRPVIAFAAGGPLEIIADGDTGLLCRPGSVEELAAAITRLAASSADTRASMGAAGRARVIADFSLETMSVGFTAALHDVVRRGRSAAR